MHCDAPWIWLSRKSMYWTEKEVVSHKRGIDEQPHQQEDDQSSSRQTSSPVIKPIGNQANNNSTKRCRSNPTNRRARNSVKRWTSTPTNRCWSNMTNKQARNPVDRPRQTVTPSNRRWSNLTNNQTRTPVERPTTNLAKRQTNSQARRQTISLVNRKTINPTNRQVMESSRWENSAALPNGNKICSNAGKPSWVEEFWQYLFPECCEPLLGSGRW